MGLTTLRKALRSAPDGLPDVATPTIGRVRRESGAAPQETRAWCPTGTVLRQRTADITVVTDRDTSSQQC